MRKRPDFYYNGSQYIFNGYGKPVVIIQGTRDVPPGTKWI